MLETGIHATVDELAIAETINASYVNRILRLFGGSIGNARLSYWSKQPSRFVRLTCITLCEIAANNDPTRFAIDLVELAVNN